MGKKGKWAGVKMKNSHFSKFLCYPSKLVKYLFLN